jgi:hypothetical protein
MVAGEPENLTAKKEGVLGLQIMWVFNLCGLLAALGWGGVTSTLVVTARAWMTKPPSKGADVSTSMGKMTASSTMRPFKPATLSFRDERAKWEWPRRTVPLCRQARAGGHVPGAFRRGRPAGGSIADVMGRGQPACQE